MQNRVIFILCTITLLSGIAATVLFFSHGHTPLGGIHGKVGMAALALMIGNYILVVHDNRVSI